MPFLRPYGPSYSFAGFEAASPTAPKPGAQLDNEFANIALAISDLRSYVALAPGSYTRVVSAESSFPLALTTADKTILITPPLTAARSITLPTPIDGLSFDIVRTATSTGASDLLVYDAIGGLVTTLAASTNGRFARVWWDGATWRSNVTTGGFIGARRVTNKQLRLWARANGAPTLYILLIEQGGGAAAAISADTTSVEYIQYYGGGSMVEGDTLATRVAAILGMTAGQFADAVTAMLGYPE